MRMYLRTETFFRHFDTFTCTFSSPTFTGSLCDMAWTLRQGHSSSSNMIETCKGKRNMWNVSQQVRADATGAGQC
jgi:hypothetical protein